MAGPAYAIIGPSGSGTTAPEGIFRGGSTPDDLLLAGAVMLVAGAMAYFGGRRLVERSDNLGGFFEAFFLLVGGTFLAIAGAVALLGGGVWWLLTGKERRAKSKAKAKAKRRRRRARRASSN